MSIIGRILGSLEARLSQPQLNIWRTIYFNFRTLNFNQAIKFPIFIYGDMHFFMLNGKIKIDTDKITRGMIKIGCNGDSFSLQNGSGYIQLASPDSLITFSGPCRIALNSIIRVVKGELKFGKYSRIGSNSRVICNGGNITIGDNTGITFSCNIMNSSFHYTYDSIAGYYNNRTKDIHIGCRNWIGNQTTILGGTITPKDTIVGSGSLLNKSYEIYDNMFPLLAGRPASLVRKGIKRVFSPKSELMVSELFKTSNQAQIKSDEFPDNPDEVITEM